MLGYILVQLHPITRMISGLLPKTKAKLRSLAMIDPDIMHVKRNVTNLYPCRIDYHFVNLIGILICIIDFVNTKLSILEPW